MSKVRIYRDPTAREEADRHARAALGSGRAKTGQPLLDWTTPVRNWGHRDIFPEILTFLQAS